ncbi:MAG: geranylgeranyl reductase family protein [Anaerolineales bacterium]
MDYDVIIAGGSFAGLAVAAQLRGWRVLLVEPHAIGAVQTSACGTLLAVLEATGTTDSLLQVHDSFVLHLRNRSIVYTLPYPFCTFDYRAFCERLLAQGNAEILRASVLGHDGHRVYTTRGAFEAQILVDATGWRAALASGVQRKTAPQRGKSFGLETVIPVTEKGLHFYYDSDRMRPHHVGWLFPSGPSSRAGFASYQGHTRLNEGLKAFVREHFGQSLAGRHGGYFPYLPQPPTTGHVFRVGDAAGQCIPFTGEGVRPALYFGAMVGQLAYCVLAGERGETEALRHYRQFVEHHRAAYRIMLLAQRVIPGLPEGWIDRLAGRVQRPDWLNPILRAYWNALDPDMLAMAWAPLAGSRHTRPVTSPPLFPAFVSSRESRIVCRWSGIYPRTEEYL